MIASEASLGVVTGCVLFTDLVGFTQYNELVGDRAAVEVLDQQTSLAHTITASTPGARIVKELGDGLMLWFPSAPAGLGGAADFARTVADARQTGFPLAMRMGLHYGDCTERGEDLVGQTVNVAARVAEVAGPGELLVSEEVLVGCGDHSDPALTLNAIGPTSMKGVAEPIWLHRLSL